MTFKYNNVYINETSTVVGPYEAKGPFSKLYDKSYDDFYFGEKSWEQAEIKGITDSVEILLNKLNIKNTKVDVHIGGDLLNQIVATNYASSKIGIPLIGLYSACATSTLSLMLASNMIEANQIKNAIVTSSSHNNGAEKQFRNPVEYGGPKRDYTTFTTTGCASCYLSQEKSNIKVESATLGTVTDMGINDVFNMGAVMAPAAARVIADHLKDTNRTIDYYDLILTGDLGLIGKMILKEYIKKEYNISLKNYDDSACMIFDLDNQPVYKGGSGVACLPLVTYTHIIDKMKKGKLNKVLLVATGALMNPGMCNQHLTIPSISHALSLEVVK
ncbi:MAG: stage V sporulation protein AD [Bacilli bacterium]|nr:stage V sporulation protein AD [Bacilli bacterium]